MQTIALIGFGAIGTPIAHKLHNTYEEKFALVASGAFKEGLLRNKIWINGEAFQPNVISNSDEAVGEVELLLVCVKNYDLETAYEDIKNVVTKNTVILPLQNGIYSYKFFCEKFPENQIIQGYVQGPNTRRQGEDIFYSNAGVVHIGKTESAEMSTIEKYHTLLCAAGLDVRLESDIKRMVWKKWMLNVAGNSVTALTGADYSLFKGSEDLQAMCRAGMNEFLKVADLENVNLTQSDIEDVIEYYVSYRGTKKTSMLEDVLNSRRTENEYLAGDLLKIANNYGLELPTIELLYRLIKVKELLYMEKK